MTLPEEFAGTRSPWREPVVWLAIALPVAVLIAGVLLIRSAAGPGSTDTVVDRVHRVAQMQTAQLQADMAASRAGMHGLLEFDAATRRVLVSLSGPISASETLRLRLVHPTDSRADRTLELIPASGAWHATDIAQATHDWNLQLEPSDAHWRFRGRWVRGAPSVQLRPALAGSP